MPARTAIEWALANPILAAGACAYESDTGKWKLGTGTDSYLKLKYQCLAHIEGQFLPGMSWDNWGVGRDNSTWHFDHIVPVTAFDLDTAEGQRLAFHYTNLQPMWGSDNIKKGGAKRV
jgi:hypothetical protein